jgi:DNA-directed RNA polymerase specialized sigma24 family protein
MEPMLSQSIPAEPKALLSDEALLVLCGDGQQDAFRELIRRYQASIYRFLVRMLESEQDAERLAVEVDMGALLAGG